MNFPRQWYPSEKKLLLTTNGEPGSADFVKTLAESFPQIVAVDGGLKTCEENHLKPSLIIGDFDSIPVELLNKYLDIPQLQTPDQDKTDLEKALEFLFSFPLEKIFVLGAFGKRIDHSLANIHLLTHYPEKVFFESEMETCFALFNETVLNCKEGQTLSLIPVGEVANVRTQGLQWELQGNNLSNSFISISNICTCNKVKISFEKGHLICCLNRLE